MISYVFGGPTFIKKMLPIAKLNLPFLCKRIRFKIMSSASHQVKQKLVFVIAVETRRPERS